MNNDGILAMSWCVSGICVCFDVFHPYLSWIQHEGIVTFYFISTKTSFSPTTQPHRTDPPRVDAADFIELRTTQFDHKMRPVVAQRFVLCRILLLEAGYDRTPDVTRVALKPIGVLGDGSVTM